MSEFGHKFKDPEVGVFYSRLTPKKLEKIDKLRGNEYAQVLNKSAKMDYGQFLREYNPFSNPFLHEFRVAVSTIIFNYYLGSSQTHTFFRLF